MTREKSRRLKEERKREAKKCERVERKTAKEETKR